MHILQILDVFFAAHDPCTAGCDIGPQYRSIILCDNPQQEAAAMQAISNLKQSGRGPLTQVMLLPQRPQSAHQSLAGAATLEQPAAPVFWLAEAMHQDFFGTFPGNGYCRTNVVPKLLKVKGLFPEHFDDH